MAAKLQLISTFFHVWICALGDFLDCRGLSLQQICLRTCLRQVNHINWSTVPLPITAQILSHAHDAGTVSDKTVMSLVRGRVNFGSRFLRSSSSFWLSGMPWARNRSSFCSTPNRLAKVEFFKIVTPDTHWQTSIAHNFASSYPISKILGLLESPKILLSNEPKNVQIGHDLRKLEYCAEKFCASEVTIIKISTLHALQSSRRISWYQVGQWQQQTRITMNKDVVWYEGETDAPIDSPNLVNVTLKLGVLNQFQRSWARWKALKFFLPTSPRTSRLDLICGSQNNARKRFARRRRQ